MTITNVLIESGWYIGIGFVLLVLAGIILAFLGLNTFDKKVYPFVVLITILLVPFFEEVIFRAPLLLFFNSITPNAIIISVIISAYFGFIHRNNKQRWFDQISPKDNIKVSNFSKIKTVCITGFLGLLCSIITIKTQSIFYAVVIHFVYNLLVIILAAIIVVVKNQKENL